MMKGLMDRCLAREKWVDRLREQPKMELNKIKAWKELQVKKLTVTKKALEKLESRANELRKVHQDKEGKISTLKEQICWVKEDGKVEFCDSDGFFIELSDYYSDSVQECLCQVKALHPGLDVSQVSLDNVAQTLARTVDTDEVFKVIPMPDIQDDGKATPKDGQVKSVEDETCPVVEEDEPARQDQVVDEEAPVDKPQCLKFTFVFCFLFLLHCRNPFENNGYVIFLYCPPIFGFLFISLYVSILSKRFWILHLSALQTLGHSFSS